MCVTEIGYRMFPYQLLDFPYQKYVTIFFTKTNFITRLDWVILGPIFLG
jgi:hypothetical protein